ncbi:MAG: coproporphyrinogen III oxidase family protein [Gammaproteobacteria bacterium]|nr:coproporphyrinogen III oxidase family protein [Gammaproteobacteria bacterium]
MNAETLIATYLRQYNKRRLQFPPPDSWTELPPPQAGQRYLLYLHVPFCKSLCPFCSFHRVVFQPDTATRYFDALRDEIALVGEAGYRFDEVYVGGGTPTVAVNELCRTLHHLAERHDIQRISVETNPDDLADDIVGELRVAGVKRLSVGVQSFDDSQLAAMQRLENYGSGADIRAALKRVQGVFETLNVDMIFNLPGQTEALLRRDLEILTGEIRADQVSFYPLMTLSSTRERMLRAMGRVDYTREEALYRLIDEHMSAAGYRRNSVWCFSRVPGMFDEYIVERDEYVGLGSGAFSHLGESLYASTFSIPHYRELVESGHTGTFGRLRLSERDRMRHYLLLKLFGGVLDKRRADDRFDHRFQRTLWPEIALLLTLGAIRNSGNRLELTDKGRYLWIVLMREFFTGVNNLRDQMRHRGPGTAPSTYRV